MFKATGKPTKPGKTPLNYSKEAEHQKLDTAFHQLNILPEEEQFVLKHRFENRIPEREDTTIPFVQDPWTLPPQYSDQPTGPVPDHNPFIPSSVSTPIRPLQPTRVVRPKIPQVFLTHSTGTSTPGPVQQPYPGTPLPVNKLSLPALQTPSHFSSNTTPAAIAIVTAATTVPSSSASSIPISTTSAPPPATTTSTASAAISAEEAQQKSKIYYDKSTKQPKFKVGDHVLLKVEKVQVGKKKKLEPKWTVTTTTTTGAGAGTTTTTLPSTTTNSSDQNQDTIALQNYRIDLKTAIINLIEGKLSPLLLKPDYEVSTVMTTKDSTTATSSTTTTSTYADTTTTTTSIDTTTTTTSIDTTMTTKAPTDITRRNMKSTDATMKTTTMESTTTVDSATGSTIVFNPDHSIHNTLHV
ncbi:integumentary mucin C.1-like [Mytilus californianus]|uniref:integumentary mucin C.1-like n=1 Tax=Mytilus californianus TaxID=6549 RepID=UPI0022462624|nr:integumentary mucin C.1-like [Mytilus californianus]